MHAVDLIAASIPATERAPLPCETREEVCCITGETALCIPRKTAIKDCFTNSDLLKSPESKWVSVDAFQALKYKWERMSSWICDGRSFTRLNRQGVRAAVFGDTPSTPWAAYATTSYKKHGSLWTPINSGARRVWRFEMKTVDLSDGSFRAIWETMLAWQKRGVSRNAMETMMPGCKDIQIMGYKTWMDFCEWAEPLAHNSTYLFMCYLLPSREELEHEFA